MSSPLPHTPWTPGSLFFFKQHGDLSGHLRCPTVYSAFSLICKSRWFRLSKLIPLRGQTNDSSHARRLQPVYNWPNRHFYYYLLRYQITIPFSCGHTTLIWFPLILQHNIIRHYRVRFGVVSGFILSVLYLSQLRGKSDHNGRGFISPTRGR